MVEPTLDFFILVEILRISTAEKFLLKFFTRPNGKRAHALLGKISRGFPTRQAEKSRLFSQ